jgi:hypothetical protein
VRVFDEPRLLTRVLKNGDQIQSVRERTGRRIGDNLELEAVGTEGRRMFTRARRVERQQNADEMGV